MKDFCAIALVWGWFFVAQTPWQNSIDGKTKITQIVGDFRTQVECDAAFDDIQAMFKQLKVPVRMQKCTLRQDI